jgi:hypothetical protein
MSAGTPASVQRCSSAVQDVGQVELAVDHGVTVGAGVGEIDRHLGVLDPSGGAGVLALHAHGADPFLEVAGFVDHQHRIGVTETGGDVVAQVITHPVGVPAGPVEQVLHAVRIPVAASRLREKDRCHP